MKKTVHRCYLFTLAKISEEDGGLVDILLIPAGEVESRNGAFLCDADCAEEIIGDMRWHGSMIPIDYEHQSHGGGMNKRDDGRAPACGWIHSLRWEEGQGIIASVDWLDEARDDIRARRYLYISPVILMEKHPTLGNRATGLLSVALTNTPAICHLPAVAAKTQEMETETMADAPESQANPTLLVGQIAGELGIEMGENVQESELLEKILDRVKQLNAGASEPEESGSESEEAVTEQKALKALLELDDNAPPEAVRIKVQEFKDAKHSLASLQREVDQLKAAATDRQVDELVSKAVAENKINPLNEDDFEACRELARKDPAMFKKMMDGRTPYAQPGRTETPTGLHKGGKSREQVIEGAEKTFENDASLHKVTSKVAYVNQALRESSLSVLSQDEREKYPQD